MMTRSSVGNRRPRVVDRVEVDRGVLADGGVRAAAGLDAHDALGRERAASHQELRVLLGVDVVGDDGDLEPSRRCLQSASTSAVFPEPTGPATPTRRGCSLVIDASSGGCLGVMSGTGASRASRAGRWRWLDLATPSRSRRRATRGRAPPAREWPRPAAASMRWPALCPERDQAHGRAGDRLGPGERVPRQGRRQRHLELGRREREHRGVRDVEARRPAPGPPRPPGLQNARQRRAELAVLGAELARGAAGESQALQRATAARSPARQADEQARQHRQVERPEARLEQPEQPGGRLVLVGDPPLGHRLLETLRIGEGADRQRGADDLQQPDEREVVNVHDGDDLHGCAARRHRGDSRPIRARTARAASQPASPISATISSST